MIPKSEVGVLSEDSNNVVELIKTAYSVSPQPTPPSFVIALFCFFFFILTTLSM